MQVFRPMGRVFLWALSGGVSLQLTVASQRWICDHPHHKPQGWS